MIRGGENLAGQGVAESGSDRRRLLATAWLAEAAGSSRKRARACVAAPVAEPVAAVVQRVLAKIKVPGLVGSESQRPSVAGWTRPGGELLDFSAYVRTDCARRRRVAVMGVATGDAGPELVVGVAGARSGAAAGFAGGDERRQSSRAAADTRPRPSTGHVA